MCRQSMGCPTPCLLGDHREALNLDEGGFVPQSVHADSGHCRITRAGQPPPDSADLLAMSPVVPQVRGVDSEAGQMLGSAARSPQSGEQVAERLLELVDDVPSDEG